MFTASGKILVVVAVLAVIFIGIVIFLIITDNKIRKIEGKVDAIQKNTTAKANESIE